MALDDVLRAGVATANSVTKSLQVPVIHRAFIGQTPYGDAQFAPVSTAADGSVLTAVVEMKQTMRQLPNGVSQMSAAHIMFIQPVPVNGTQGINRIEPIDVRDYIELPNGVSGPVIDVESVLDSDTNEGYYAEVWLGEHSVGQSA